MAPKHVRMIAADSRDPAQHALTNRLAIDDIRPVIGAGDIPAKALVGQVFPVSASVWREGHDAISATVVFCRPDTTSGASDDPIAIRMTPDPLEVDRRHGSLVVPDEPGLWSFRIEAWSDPTATWFNAVTKKRDAGQDAAALSNDLLTGAELFDDAAALHDASSPAHSLLRTAAAELRDDSLPLDARLATALGTEAQRVLTETPVRELVTASNDYPFLVEPQRSGVGSWYEFFPRSTGGVDADGVPVHGTFATATAALERISDMGFDVVYLPPIHPIGTINRKGKNNTLTPTPDDVGSPWAIGSAAGGHDAIHPELGTVEDFAAFVARAEELGLAIALDLALQCAPDHPWAQEHPEWFTVLPDGTIAYAENPPKKYQDIYPLNFDNDPEGIYTEILRVVQLWIERGVRVFRVDNPHTKPTNFWSWLIARVHETDPDVVFLAEAFTRPPRLYGLGKAGFTQSYSYFTWKTTQEELTEFARDCADYADVFRPNLFVNTPDILHESLQTGGRAMFAIRAALAATISPLWGMYSGYELYEHVPVAPGSEEYLDSEKYELRPRDFDAIDPADTLVPYITLLNRWRTQHPALQQQRNLHFHEVSDERLLAYSKVDPVSGDAILVIVNLDPNSVVEGTVTVDLEAIGQLDYGSLELDPDAATGVSYSVHDLPSGATYTWAQENYVRLDPVQHVAHIFELPTVPAERRDFIGYRTESVDSYDPRR